MGCGCPRRGNSVATFCIEFSEASLRRLARIASSSKALGLAGERPPTFATFLRMLFPAFLVLTSGLNCSSRPCRPSGFPSVASHALRNRPLFPSREHTVREDLRATLEVLSVY
jgi:hypothetical protein